MKTHTHFYPFVLVPVLFISCGKPAEVKKSSLVPVSAKEKAVPQKLIDLLKIKIVGQRPPGQVPDPNWVAPAPLKVALETQIKQNQKVLFPHPISLSEPLFFTFENQVNGIPVVSAYFTYLVQNPMNEKQIYLRTVSASKDPDHSIWFVPIAELTKTLHQEGYEFSENDVHILKLDLVLGYAQTESAEIRFRISP
ncbi:MAG: hypothetical protein HYX41_00570 [Bdellovibrio sp.]|nr:hypothetical protein [Bdellovibrio sp.]